MFVTPEIQARYLGRRETDIATIRDALAKDNFTLAAKLGHDWKGNGETYGFPEFSRWGRELEKAAQAGQADVIQKMLSEISQFLQDRKAQGSI